MLAAERINIIMQILQEKKSAMVSDLSQTLNVSEETIRRDLEKLEKNKKIRRVHGGAFLLEGFEKGAPVGLRKQFLIEEKKSLGKACIELIEDRDTIMLDCSTTSLFIAKEIKESPLQVTVITNFLDIMAELSNCRNVKLIGLGGTLRESSGSFNGHTTTSTLIKYCADKAFISCSAVNMRNGITDHYENEARIRELMLNNSEKKILVVDHTKLNNTTTNFIAGLSDIDYLVTDQPLSEAWKTELIKQGVNFIISSR